MAKGKACKSKRKPKGYFLGGLFGGGDSKTETTIEQPDYIKNLSPLLEGTIRGEAKRPWEQTVAPFSQDTLGAFEQLRQLATEDPTGYGSELAFAKQAIRSGFDANEPWNEKLIGATLADYDYGADMDRARRARDQAGRGAFGDRAYVANAEADRVLNNDRALLASRMREEGITRRQGAAEALAGLAGQERGTALQGAGLLEGVGAKQDARTQQVLDTPNRRIAMMGSVFGGAPSATNQQVSQATNPLQSVAGLGLAGAGIASLLGFKDGGKIDKYADGGSITPTDIERAKKGDPDAIARIRAAMEYRPGGAFMDSRSTVERERQPVSALEDPRMKAAEERRQSLGGAAASPGFMEWWRQNFSEARSALPGAPQRAAQPDGEELGPPTAPRPMPRPAAAGPQPAAGALREATTPRTQTAGAGPAGAFARAPMPSPNPRRLTAQQSAMIDDVIAPQPGAPLPQTEPAAGVTPGGEDRGAFGKWFANPLLLAGLATLAADPSRGALGAMGQGGLTAMNMMADYEDAESRRALAEEEQKRRGAFDDYRRQQDMREDERWRMGYEKDREDAAARERLERDKLALAERETDARLAALAAGRTWSGSVPGGARGGAAAAKNPFQSTVDALHKELARLETDQFATPEDIARTIEAIARYESYGVAPAAGGGTGAPPPPPGFNVVP